MELVRSRFRHSSRLVTETVMITVAVVTTMTVVVKLERLMTETVMITVVVVMDVHKMEEAVVFSRFKRYTEGEITLRCIARDAAYQRGCITQSVSRLSLR
jgi:hypothetical protein